MKSTATQLGTLMTMVYKLEESFNSKHDYSPEGNVAELVVHGQNLEDRPKNNNVICIIQQENIKEENMS